VAGDYAFQQWSKFQGYGLIAPTNRNSYRVSVGGEVQSSREGLPKTAGTTAYRAGLFYNSSYYLIDNQPINETGVTGGVGLPLFLDTRVDIALQYSMRGTTTNQLQKDKIIRLSITLSGDELWFVRAPEE
jgi:hypothetical protein